MMGIKDYQFRGLCYDEWELNREHITGARTITETDVVNFAGLSGDWSATHTNDVYGKSTIYGSRIVYGNVTFIVSTGLMAQTMLFDGTSQGLVDMKISYQEPVRFGDTIYCRFLPVEKRPTKQPDKGLVVFHVFVYNQRDEQVAEERLTYLISAKKPVLA